MSKLSQAMVPWVEGLPEDTIFNPGNRWHFMRVKPFKGKVCILKDGEVLAVSTDTVRLIEIGNDFYDPVLYLPIDDIAASLVKNDAATYCPLKGSAIYFDLAGCAASSDALGIAWSYPKPLDFATEIAGRVAFYPNQVIIEETSA
ncbi:MAG: DUF427 domain-containing protein [Pseudomonadota bacterium]